MSQAALSLSLSTCNCSYTIARPRYCHECQTCLISLTSKSLCIRYEERHRIPQSACNSDRYSMCKRIRPIIDFPLSRTSLRAYTCSACYGRRRDSYREQKGEQVSKEGQAQRFAQARQVVEKALQERLQKEKIRRQQQERREQQIRGESQGIV